MPAGRSIFCYRSGDVALQRRCFHAACELYLHLGDFPQAIADAGAGEHPDCAYAWGKADGLHFCGLAHLRLGERELARQRLAVALELRERLGHGRIEETRRALELCRP